MKIDKHTLNKLKGKTIQKVEQYKIIDHDDIGYLKVTFTDDSFVFIEAWYGMYTGNSEGEYPTGINILPMDYNLKELEPIKNGNSKEA